MKKLLVILFIIFLTGCESKMITYEKTKNLKNTLIIDVREKVEYKNGHIKNSINIPLSKIENEKLDKEKNIIVYCKSGTRSNMAYQILKEKGYKVFDLGSIDNWKEELVEG